MLVDYAHTPDSLENVLRAAAELARANSAHAGRVICVFGAGGDRDRGKRPLMGEIAARLADLVIVTSDNPRSEEPGQIIAEIMAGTEPRVPRDGVRSAIEDRRAAIARAVVACARSGDVVVIAGKGHEQGQEFAGGHKVPFDDVSVAREALGAVAAALPGRPADAPWDAERDRRCEPAQSCCEGSEARALAGPPAVGDRLASRYAVASCSSACAASATTAARTPARPCGRAPGVCSSRPRTLSCGRGRRAERRRGRRARARGPAARRCRRSPAPGAASCGARRRRVVAITGSTGKTSTKDILAALLGGRGAHGGEPGQPQHRDRPAAGDPRWPRRRTSRCWCSRWRCAGPARSPS